MAILDPKCLTEEIARSIAAELVGIPTDWIDVLGSRAEYLHDLIDQASVETRRQSRIGDGNPMTAWDEEIADLEGIAGFVALGGSGGEDYVVLLVVGPEYLTAEFVLKTIEAVKARAT